MIYFIQNAVTKAVKIGYSTNVKGRLASLRTASPDPLRLLGTVPGDMADERRLHARFGRHRLSGEWFSPAPELTESIREMLADRGGARPSRPDQPTPREICDLMSLCVNAAGYLLSSSRDLKFHVNGDGGPCERYPELGPTEFKVVVYVRDPETVACGTATIHPGDDSGTIQTRIAEVVAEIAEQNAAIAARPKPFRLADYYATKP